MPPTATGSAAANRPPNTQTNTKKLSGIAIDSISSRSCCDWSVICTLTIAIPPDRTVTPSRSCVTCSDSSLAYFCWSLSLPLMPAMIRPAVPSLLIRSLAAGGGAVHGDVTLATCGERRSWSTMSVPTALACGLSKPAVAETVSNSWTPPWPNLSVSSWAPFADSDVGSWNPLADRLFATGTPKMASASVSNAATVMTRRGAAMASRAIRCSRSVLFRQAVSVAGQRHSLRK